MALTEAKSGARARWSLAYSNLAGPPVELTRKYGNIIEELDMSNNRVSDLRFLADFPKLNTLVVDHNAIHSHVKIPYMPGLHTIWLNHNSVKNLGIFLETLSKNCPNLRYLSLMNNEAAPSYFNGGTLQQYTEFRYLVISSLSKLEYLDFQPVTQQERREAEKAYSIKVKKKTSKGSIKKSSTENLS
ncbi:hypothetical protein LOTGIDRAFT_223705 [Lottia gigantea]|uniref:U2A'/phosphoprotein 32 family A C-terminal domain-containing protein n=1 Tax=Lottia gigantea TaxID=225164 RepID=V3ZMA9_LOTGI|nr:hypothetical protein LOTGIDRAFT_223705 [Lottia gigantea]ESO81966.1 hypothetical protein LOTGIDRAFT_223705 [Lottia gigantea]